METKANYVAIGAFVLAGVIGLVVAVVWLAGSQYREEYTYYRAFFEGPVTGLGKGTSVRYDGIEVGRVGSLDFDPDNPKLVIVNLEVNPSLAIHSDSEASIASLGLTGGSYVEIDGGSKNAPILRPGPGGEKPVIRTKPSTLEELEQSAPQLVAKLNRIADHLDDVLNDKNRQAIAQLLDHLRNTTALVDRDGPTIDKMLQNLSSASGTLNTDLGDVHRVMGHADQATQHFDLVASDLDKQINSVQIGQFVAETRALVQSLTTLSNELEQQPTRILYGDRRKGYTPP